MNRLAILALRGVIVLMFLGLVAIQVVVLPAIAFDTREDLSSSPVQVPVAIIGFLGLLLVEVALVCIWRLLTMVRRETVFSAAAFRYVDVIIGAAIGATALAVVLSFLLAPGDEVPPGMVLLVVVGGVGTAGIALLMLVMRALLAKAVALDATATTLQAELDEVI